MVISQTVMRKRSVFLAQTFAFAVIFNHSWRNMMDWWLLTHAFLSRWKHHCSEINIGTNYYITFEVFRQRATVTVVHGWWIYELFSCCRNLEIDGKAKEIIRHIEHSCNICSLCLESRHWCSNVVGSIPRQNLILASDNGCVWALGVYNIHIHTRGVYISIRGAFNKYAEKCNCFFITNKPRTLCPRHVLQMW